VVGRGREPPNLSKTACCYGAVRGVPGIEGLIQGRTRETGKPGISDRHFSGKGGPWRFRKTGRRKTLRGQANRDGQALATARDGPKGKPAG